MVSFSPNERYIGGAAKLYWDKGRNLENTVFDAKRLIGRTYQEPTIQMDMKTWPFAVVRSGIDDKPIIQGKFSIQFSV